METEPLLVNTGDTEVRAQANDVNDNEEMAKRSRRWNLFKLNLITFFYYIGSYPIVTTTDQYAQQAITKSFKNASHLTWNRHECLEGNTSEYRDIQLEIQSKTAVVMIMVTAAGLVPQFVVTFLLGPCSDQIGRKLGFILPSVGGCLKAVIFLTISHFELSYYYLIVGSFVEGLFGAFPLFFTAAIAYIADLTEVKDRSLWLCVIDCTIGLSIVGTNIAAGYIITLLGFSWMYLTLSVTFAICAVLCITVMQETVQRDEKAKVKVFTLLHMKRSVRLYTRDNGTNRRWKLLMLLGIGITLNVAAYESADACTFLMTSHPVCFTPELFGFFIACLYVSKTVGGLGLMKANDCGVGEGGLLCLSISSYIVYEIVLSWAHHLGTVFFATLIGFAQLLSNPLVRSLISPLGSADEQGALFAAATWLQQLSLLIGNAYQNTLYAATVSIWRGLFLMVDAGVHTVCLLLVVILLVLWRREDKMKSREGRNDLGPNYGSVQAVEDNALPTA